MGKNNEVGQLKPIGCTYAECIKRFDTEKEMKRHKLNDPDHFYCKKCDYDGIDDRDLTLHKVAAMQPWVEGRMRHNKHESPKHIVCEFCGMDFKSFEGRKIHREQIHPADQSIECPGCHTMFTRAGNYLAHFENDRCPEITRRQFLGHVQHKHVNNEIMKAPDEFREKLEINELTRDNLNMIEKELEDPDVEEGGAPLLDADDEHQQRGIRPLQAEMDLIETNQRPPLTSNNVEQWPRLLHSKTTQLNESLRKLSISSSMAETRSGGAAIHGSQMSASEYASQITSRRGSNIVYTEPSTPLNSPKCVVPYGEDDSASEADTTQASSTNGVAPWTAASTSQVLFKDVKTTRPSANWDAVLEKRAEESQTIPATNILRSRFWDPTSTEFDLMKFEDRIEGRYHCPFDGCEDVVFYVGADMIGHLQHAHLKTRYRCPLCLKVFKTPSALIGHSESTGKCKVKKSGLYDKLLDEVSGGFLKAEHLQEPKIAKGKDGTLDTGIMSTRFEAKMPNL